MRRPIPMSIGTILHICRRAIARAPSNAAVAKSGRSGAGRSLAGLGSLVSTCGRAGEPLLFFLLEYPARLGSIGGRQMANRVWLVTGASRGIGMEIAKAVL